MCQHNTLKHMPLERITPTTFTLAFNRTMVKGRSMSVSYIYIYIYNALSNSVSSHRKHQQINKQPTYISVFIIVFLFRSILFMKKTRSSDLLVLSIPYVQTSLANKQILAKSWFLAKSKTSLAKNRFLSLVHDFGTLSLLLPQVESFINM